MLPYLLPPTHYHSVSLALPPEARTRLLLLHGNHLLVSLSCFAASVIHNTPQSRADAAVQTSNLPLRFLSSSFSLPCLILLFAK